jgi:hypothetical protein
MEYYIKKVEKQLRKKYMKEFNVEACLIGIFSHEEKVERYARNMLFWLKNRPLGEDLNNYIKLAANILICCNAYIGLYKNVKKWEYWEIL